MASESEFVSETVMPALRKLPASEWERIEQKSIRGTADIIGCIRGKFIWLEAKKSESHKVGKLQGFKLGRFKKAGAIAFKIDPTNWPKIYTKLKALAGKPRDTPIDEIRRYEI